MNATGICLNDDAFGPAVQGCRGDFDFTQKFESLFLAIIPSSVFIALTLARVAVLVQQPRIVTGAVFQYVKLVSTKQDPLVDGDAMLLTRPG